MDPTNVYRIMDAFGQQEDEQQENAASSGLSGHMVDTHLIHQTCRHYRQESLLRNLLTYNLHQKKY